MYKIQAITTFVGTREEVIQYVNEFNDLTSCCFSYEKRNDNSWIIFGDVDQESIDKYNLHSDFVIDAPSNLEVYENGEVESIQFSKKIDSLNFYHYIVHYRGRVYELEVSDDEISQEVENPTMPAKML